MVKFLETRLAIYNVKSVEESLKKMPVEDILSVVNLTARCHLSELLTAALHCLPPAYLSQDVLLEVALEAHTDCSEERPKTMCNLWKVLYDHKRNQHVDLCRCNICHKYFDNIVKRNIHIQKMHI